MQSGDFSGGQKAGEFRAGISPDALRRIGGDQAGRDRGIQDLAKHLERPVRAAGGRLAVRVEPSLHTRTADQIQPERAEGGQELFRQYAVDGFVLRFPPSARRRCFPFSQGVFPKQGTFRSFIPARNICERPTVLDGPAFLPGILDGHERGRADGQPDRRAVGLPVVNEAAMSRGAHANAEPGNPAVPDDEFRLVRFQPLDAGIRQAGSPRLSRHVRPRESTGARASTASRTDASERWAYFRVVEACS